jgi:regulatory protein
MPVDRAWLERVAREYLERYPTTAANLRRVLRRRIRTGVAKEGGDIGELDAIAEALVARLVELGAVNDAAFVEARVRTLLRRGKAPPAIRQALLAKGARREEIDPVLATVGSDATLEAAARLVRRRRFGPYHDDPRVRRERRTKELQALARAGFRYDEAARVLDLPETSLVEALLVRPT